MTRLIHALIQRFADPALAKCLRAGTHIPAARTYPPCCGTCGHRT